MKSGWAESDTKTTKLAHSALLAALVLSLIPLEHVGDAHLGIIDPTKSHCIYSIVGKCKRQTIRFIKYTQNMRWNQTWTKTGPKLELSTTLELEPGNDNHRSRNRKAKAHTLKSNRGIQ